MERNEMAFIKQGIVVTRDWDDFQRLVRRAKRILTGELNLVRKPQKER
ncbi:MAG: hypothetical protein ACK5PS_09655 [Desulfopila sp.]